MSWNCSSRGLSQPGSARGRWRSESPKPQWTCTGNGSPVASLASSAASSGPRTSRRRNVEVEAAAVGRDRLERDEASLARRGDLAGDRLLAVLLDDAFDPHDRPRLATGELAELVPARAGARRRIAVVDEQPLRARRSQQRRRVLGRVGRETAFEHVVLRGLAFEVAREHHDRAPVREAGRDMGPLARVGALGEEPAELVDARRVRAQDPVRVLVDERNRAQYFSKWPCCSNVSSPSE